MIDIAARLPYRSDVLADFFLGALIVIAVAPLLLVGVLALMNTLDRPLPLRLLDALAWLLKTQWIVAGLTNSILGLGLVGTGLWLAAYSSLAWRWPMAIFVIAFGFWRMWRGVSVLRTGDSAALE